MTPEQLAAGQAWAADRRRRYRLLMGDRNRWAAYSFEAAEAADEQERDRKQ